MIRALQAHAAKHALSYAIALALALSASLIAYCDNFGLLIRADMDRLSWWQVLALVAKVLNPGIIALIGFLMKSPLNATAQPEEPATHGASR